MAEQHFTNISSAAITLACSLSGLSYFIYLLHSDAQQAYKKRAHWIPGNAFILSALTIQILSYLDTSSVTISDKPNFGEMALLLGNHLLIESERLIICVFMGYLLPGMARPGSGGQWRDISALAITLITDITSELFFLHKSKDLFKVLTSRKIVQKVDYDYRFEMAEEFEKQPSIRTWFMVSSVGILISLIFLILFLVSAIIAGNTIRGVLSQRISAALSTNKTDKSWEWVEEEVFKSWIVARSCRPEYVLARSVLSSGAGVVVTLRIILSVLKFSFVHYKSVVLLNDGLDELRKARLVFQYAFVLVGWAVVCWRWMTAILYFPRLNNNKRGFFIIEDFWTRAISQMRFGWVSSNSLHEEDISKAQLHSRVISRLSLCLLRSVENFVGGFLMALQSLVVVLAKFCWVLSEIAIGNKFVRGCVLGRLDLYFYTNQEAVKNEYEEFCKYRRVLKRVCMPQETPGSLWLASRKSINQIKERLKSGYEDAKKYRELVELISTHYKSDRSLVIEFESLPLVKAYFPNLEKMCWKMTAVSYLKVIAHIFPSSERVSKAMKAYTQAEDFMNSLDRAEIESDGMDFLDRLGMEAGQMSKAADLEFKKLQKNVSTERNINIPPADQEIRKIMLSAQQVLADNMLLDKDADGDGVELQDSKDLLKIAPSYSLFRVCKRLLESTGGDMMDLGEDQLGNLFAHCVSQARDKVVENCRSWAKEFDEDKIWDAVYIAGKVKWVLENYEAGAQA